MPATPYQSALVNRTILIGSRRSSIRLEQATWTAFHEVAVRESIAPHQLCMRIWNWKPKDISFTVAVRQYLMEYFRAAATEDGHTQAEHGSIVVRMRSAARRAPARAA
jgi:predicted DNA-binding ribbon-helix-helix protein